MVKLLLFVRVQGLNELGHDLAAVGAFEQRLFDGSEDGIDFRTHGVADVRDLGFPVAVMENADEGFCRTSLEMLLLAELHKLRARSLRWRGGTGSAADLRGRSWKFGCHNEIEDM
jgi:hypothetical protein